MTREELIDAFEERWLWPQEDRLDWRYVTHSWPGPDPYYCWMAWVEGPGAVRTRVYMNDHGQVWWDRGGVEHLYALAHQGVGF